MRLYSLTSCHSFFSVRQVLNGYKKSNIQRDTRSPITPAILSKICRVTSVVCSSVYESTLFTSVFTLAFLGAFRISELLPASNTSRGGFLLSNILLVNGDLRLFLRISKIDPKGLETWIKLGSCKDKNICPVAALKYYLDIRSAESTLLFIHRDGSPLTIYQFSAVLKKCLVHKFTTH